MNLERTFKDENESCSFSFQSAIWATDQLNDIFHNAKLSILKDVDFVVETEENLIFIEYKNSNHIDVTNPAAFNPRENKKIIDVARKYYDSLNFIRALGKGKNKKKIYVYIVEVPNGDKALRGHLRDLLCNQLPFLLSDQNELQENMIDLVQVLSIDEWNKFYKDFPAKRLKEAITQN